MRFDIIIVLIIIIVLLSQARSRQIQLEHGRGFFEFRLRLCLAPLYSHNIQFHGQALDVSPGADGLSVRHRTVLHADRRSGVLGVW